jgi:hypothetical protein
MLDYFELKSTSKEIQSSNYLDTNIYVINNLYKNKPNIKPMLLEKSLVELKTLATECKLKNTRNKKILINRIILYKKLYNNYHNKDKIWNLKTYNKKDYFKTTFYINTFLPISQHFCSTTNGMQSQTNYMHT